MNSSLQRILNKLAGKKNRKRLKINGKRLFRQIQKQHQILLLNVLQIDTMKGYNNYHLTKNSHNRSLITILGDQLQIPNVKNHKIKLQKFEIKQGILKLHQYLKIS